MAMILLGAENKVLQESITHRMEAEKKEPCDAKLYDFDDVFYRIFIDPDARTKMLVSVRTPNWSAVRSKGSEEWVKEKLGDFVTDCNEDGCNFEISLDDSAAAKAKETGDAFSKLRVYTLGGPLYSYCKALRDKSPMTDVFSFQFRRDTYMWICGKKDRITVVFGFEFNVEADRIIANQILTEFTEVRRARDLQATPSVGYSKDPPSEISGQKIPPFNKNTFLGYFSVLLLPSHVVDKKIVTAVENVIGFRAYLTYHIKCAKAFFHQSMRARCKKSLKVLNRARYEPDDERKKKKIIVGAK